MLWFLKTSVDYVHPRGALGWLKFALGFPRAYVRFARCMAQSEDSKP